MPREYGLVLIAKYLFAASSNRQQLDKNEFQTEVSKGHYIFIKPERIREEFTKFVIDNRSRAMLPALPIRRSIVKDQHFENRSPKNKGKNGKKKP